MRPYITMPSRYAGTSAFLLCLWHSCASAVWTGQAATHRPGADIPNLSLGERPLCANSGHCRKVGFWHDRDMPASRRPEMARAPPKRRFLISKAGNRYLRAALYMPALVAVQHDPSLRAFYQRLLDHGKAKLQALVAVMRKLLHAAWGMFRNDQPYDGAKLCPQA